MSDSTSIVQINDRISYLPSCNEPLSSEVVFIKDTECTWIFDTGTSSAAADAINAIEGTKKIVISHWHPDHTFNLVRVKYDDLYVSRHSKKHLLRGTLIEAATSFGNISIVPLPSSHEKGCLCLVTGDYAFLGDGTYRKASKGNLTFNVQLLQAQIALLEQLPVKYLCVDHRNNFVQEKDSVLKNLKKIYSRRQEGNPLIILGKTLEN